MICGIYTVMQRMELPESRLNEMTFERLATMLLFVAIGAGACFAPAQNDTWWHLRTGQDIWTTGAIDLHDRYSYTVAGGYWPDHEWLSQLLFYAIYRTGGLPLLTAITACVIVGAWFLIWRLTPGDWPRKHLVCALALVPSSMAWSLRPQVFTLFLVAATAFLLVRRRYLLLPPLFVLWANLHGGVMLGFVILAGSTVALLFEQRKWPVRLLVATIGCLAATILTPLGTSIWTEIPGSLARLREYGVTEWRPPALADPRLLPFWLLVVGFITLSVRETPWRLVALRSNAMFWATLGLLPLALSSGRNVPPFLLLAVPAIAAMQHSSKASRTLLSVERPAVNAGILGVLTLLAASSVTYAWVSEVPGLGWHPLPEQAIESLKSCPERLYNRYDEGGYLIWFVPDRKVFLDSRQDPYPPALVNEQIQIETSGNYQGLFDRFGVRCVLTPVDSVLAERLLADGWERIYNGNALMVLTLKPTLHQPRR
jgi:hypothetical protein